MATYKKVWTTVWVDWLVYSDDVMTRVTYLHCCWCRDSEDRLRFTWTTNTLRFKYVATEWFVYRWNVWRHSLVHSRECGACCAVNKALYWSLLSTCCMVCDF